MSVPVADFRRAMKKAVEMAQRGCRTNRTWELNAQDRFRQTFDSSEGTVEDATRLFDAWILDLGNTVTKKKNRDPDYEDEFIYHAIVPCPFKGKHGRMEIYFHFTLQDDLPEDPCIRIVSAHEEL